MQDLEGRDLKEWLSDSWTKLQEWLRPNPGDSTAVTVFKTIYKSIAVLLLVALSPAILIILSFVFFAAF